MKLLPLLLPIISLVFAEEDALDETHTATVLIQPLLPTAPSPSILATLSYNPSTLFASLLSFEPPVIPDSSSGSDILLRISLPTSHSRSTTLASSASFQKGYRPLLLLSLDTAGDVASVSVKSEVIDAGQTRDFGPRVEVRQMEKVRGPVLNRPVVLKEGKVEEVVEKTLLQK